MAEPLKLRYCGSAQILQDPHVPSLCQVQHTGNPFAAVLLCRTIRLCTLACCSMLASSTELHGQTGPPANRFSVGGPNCCRHV